ncbi:hypothetical protein L218DRAFT_176296 [Marasmius fiardii PR-910]|nr:hypothetical protein L218DRAFT_176296 [Marasmius fiardii PR-910]
MFSEERKPPEVPKAPKLGTLTLEDDDDGDLPGIPIQLNNFGLDPDFDTEMLNPSQSPTPTQNKDPSALFAGAEGLRSAFNSPSKRKQYECEDGNGDNLLQRSPSEKYIGIDKGGGKGKFQDRKGKGKAVEVNRYGDGDAMIGDVALSPTGTANPDEGVWEAYERYSHSNQQEFNKSSTSKGFSSSRPLN